MPPRKRGRAEMEAVEPSQPVKVPTLLSQLRNMWEFSNIMQFIYIFGKALKIDEDFDIEDLEDECMKPEPSVKLAEIGLCILKFLSSHRGLTSENFDEHTARQYKRRSPDNNPFGEEEAPKRFLDFDVFTKLRVLCQMSRWVFCFPDRLREKMPELKETDQLVWRIDAIGWDSKERSYFVLDDNRLYRKTEPAIPLPPPAKLKAPPKPKANPKAKASSKPKVPEKVPRAGIRSSKRRKTAEIEETERDEEPEPIDETPQEVEAINGDLDEPGPGEYKWECIAITLQDYQSFLETIKKSKDIDEKSLYRSITIDILPVIEKLEEERQKKIARRQKELLNMEKMAHAKRSSRLAGKQEREQQEAEARAAAEKREADLAAARKDAERQKQMEEARESRMMTREQRLKEREYKRLLHEEELKRLEEDSVKLDAGDARLSERHLKAEMAKKQKALEELQEEEDWVFDCAKCGVHGENIDDGSHSVACDKCNVWQHSACLGISQSDAEKDDFQFICNDCKRREEDKKRREEDAKKPKIPSLKFKVPSATSPHSVKDTVRVEEPISTSDAGDSTNQKRKLSDSESMPGMPPMKKWKPPAMAQPQAKHSNGFGQATNGMGGASMHQSIMQGPTLTPHGQHVNGTKSSPPPGLQSPQRPSSKSNGIQPESAQIGVFSSTMHFLNGKSNVTKPSHPTLPAPSPNVGQRSSPPSQTTPYSSFGNGQQTPAASQRSSFTTPKNGASFAKSPAQSPAYLNSPSTNLPPSSAAAPILHPGFSPQKAMPSSPPPAGNSSPQLHDRSSPMIAPPSADLQAAGASPLKHEPPRPHLNHDQAEAPLFPPPHQHRVSPQPPQQS